jgi:RNA polymerase sigma-70 factor (ECF subfamily)
VPTTDEDFATLLGAVRRGDPEAISRLYRREQPRLLRVLRAEVGDAADDVASQTWLEVMRVLDRFEGSGRGFRALLFTIARRRLADHRRGRVRRPATPTQPADLYLVRDAGPGVEHEALARLGADDAVEVLNGILEPLDVEILLLRVVADLPADDVAAIVGLSTGAVRVRQHRAVKRLAAALGRVPVTASNDSDASGDGNRS